MEATTSNQVGDYNTMLVSEVGGLTLVVYADVQPTDAEIRAMLEDAAKRAPRKCMVVLGDARVTVSQRKTIASSVNANRYKAANMVSSVVTRGFVTAVAWLTNNADLAAFSMEEIEKGADWLGIDKSHHAELRRVIDEQRAQLAARHAQVPRRASNG